MNTPEPAPALPARTTPTWEVELLISGVAVFAMLQLPGWLDDRMFALQPRVSDGWQTVLLMSYLYAKSAAIVLAVTFAAHLLMRAQWIALVGMHSVYPQGVRLDRLRMGPVQRAIEAARADSTGDAIERADNRASVVFALGVSVAFIIATILVFFCGSLLLVTLFSQAIGWRIDPFETIVALLALVMLPWLAAGLVDQHYGARLQPDGAAHRVIAVVLGLYTRIGMGRRNNRIVATLTSNGGERRMMALVVGIMLAAIIGVATSYRSMRSTTAFGSYALFPGADASDHGIKPAHYDDQRNPDRDEAVPFVQSSVVTGPYLQLLVPFQPGRNEPAMRKRCAHAQRLEGAARSTARLACLAQLHAVTLDGMPLGTLRYEIASDPRTGRPALLAMIDVRTLAKGRHELRVARPPRTDRKPDKGDPDPGFDRIPFWN